MSRRLTERLRPRRPKKRDLGRSSFPRLLSKDQSDDLRSRLTWTRSVAPKRNVRGSYVPNNPTMKFLYENMNLYNDQVPKYKPEP